MLARLPGCCARAPRRIARLLRLRHQCLPGSSDVPCRRCAASHLQVKGYKACTISNAKGAAVLSSFGIDASRLTTWVLVLDCLYAAALLLALASLYRSMPRRAQRAAPRAAEPRVERRKGSGAQRVQPPLVAASV